MAFLELFDLKARKSTRRVHLFFMSYYRSISCVQMLFAQTVSYPLLYPTQPWRTIKWIKHCFHSCRNSSAVESGLIPPTLIVSPGGFTLVLV